MYVSRQAIKIKTKKYFTQNKISISSIKTTFEMITRAGKPKNRTAGMNGNEQGSLPRPPANTR